MYKMKNGYKDGGMAAPKGKMPVKGKSSKKMMSTNIVPQAMMKDGGYVCGMRGSQDYGKGGSKGYGK